MKHVFVLGLSILLLASCTKQNSLIEVLEPQANEQTELSKKSGLTSIDGTPITYKYFLDEIPVGEGSFSINDPNLVVHLTAKEIKIDNRTSLDYEFHAFNNELHYYEWATGQDMLAERAISMANTLSQYVQNTQVANYFQTNNRLPESYTKYVDELILNTRAEVIGMVDVPTVSITTYEGNNVNSLAWNLDRSYAPMLPNFINNEITAIEGTVNNNYFPTVLFDDEFYMNRLKLCLLKRS